MRILDIGAGCDKYKGKDIHDVIGLDKKKGEGIDVVWDLEKTPLPFEDSEFDTIIVSSHVFEHLTNRGLFKLMDELKRIMKKDALLKVWTPNGSSHQSYNNPDHKRGFGIGSFEHFGFVVEKKRFNFVFEKGARWKILNSILNPLLNLWQGLTEKFFPFIPDELYFELRCEK